jgi:hypothetical protein
LDSHPVPGKVAAIIMEPAVKVLAEKLKSCIERETRARV